MLLRQTEPGVAVLRAAVEVRSVELDEEAEALRGVDARPGRRVRGDALADPRRARRRLPGRGCRPVPVRQRG